jgi:uncharacterized protein (TIGR02147 family)
MAAVVGGRVPDLFSFVDYREFLRRYYEFRRAEQPSFSYRFMATRLEIDPGQLAHILQGRLHLPQRALAATLRLCKFTSREAAFFEELVRLGRSRNTAEADRSRDRLDALRTVVPRELEQEATSFYLHWRHAAVRALASLAPSTDGGELGRLCLPPQGEADASESVRLLEALGLLLRDETGRLTPAEAHVAPGQGVSRDVLRKWHAQTLFLAAESVDRFDPAQRDISTLTVALSSKDLPVVGGWISDLRRQVQAMAGAVESPDRVLQVCVQLFPVARTGSDGRTREAKRS